MQCGLVKIFLIKNLASLIYYNFYALRITSITANPTLPIIQCAINVVKKKSFATKFALRRPLKALILVTARLHDSK